MANIDLGNLTRYDGKIKEYAEDKYLSKNTANWQMTEKAGAVTCYPVPNTDLEPIVDFSFKETLPASGDKSPSNPSTINGVENIIISHIDKNLLACNFPTVSVTNGNTKIVNGLTVTNLNGTYFISGTASQQTNIKITDRINEIAPLKITSGTYTLSGYISFAGAPAGTFLRLQLVNPDNGNVVARDCVNGSLTFTIESEQLCNVYLRCESGTVFPEGFICKPQLEKNSIATSFEPSIITNYTYQLNNTYYGGSVNLATGEMTVTWVSENITSFTKVQNVLTNTLDVSTDSTQNHRSHARNTLICNKFTTIFGYDDIEHCRLVGYKEPGQTSLRFYINKSRLDVSGAVDPSAPTNAEWLNAANAWLANNTVQIVYELFNPYVIQLDPVQIKSLTALDKNTPRLNTLYTDADSIQVGYQKHPARTAYELENAILALGGGE